MCMYVRNNMILILCQNVMGMGLGVGVREPPSSVNDPLPASCEINEAIHL